MQEPMTVAQTARALGVSLDAVYRLLQANKIAASKDKHGRWLVPAAAVDQRLQRKIKKTA